MENVKHYFESYPESNECFETSNGILFHKKQDAEAHANELKDKKVITHKKGEEIESDDVEMIDVVITEEILNENPQMVEEGLKVGDVIKVAKNDADDKQKAPKKVAAKKPKK